MSLVWLKLDELMKGRSGVALTLFSSSTTSSSSIHRLPPAAAPDMHPYPVLPHSCTASWQPPKPSRFSKQQCKPPHSVPIASCQRLCQRHWPHIAIWCEVTVAAPPPSWYCLCVAVVAPAPIGTVSSCAASLTDGVPRGPNSGCEGGQQLAP